MGTISSYFDVTVLSWLIAVPVLGALAVMFTPRQNAGAIRSISFAVMVLEFAISLHLLGSGTMLSRAPVTVRPGERLSTTIRGDDLALDTILVVRWFRPDGGEYLWRVSF